MAKETYIVNGRRFDQFEDVLEYVYELGMRITNTKTIKKGTYLIELQPERQQVSLFNPNEGLKPGAQPSLF